MLCITLKAFTRICTGVSGGMIRQWLFDPADFDWTQGAAVDGSLPAYSAVARVGHGAAGTAVLTSTAVTSVTVTSGGTGYTSAPTVSFTGGGGTGAAGTAVISGGIVTGVNVTSGGTGYTTPPTVVFTGGGATAVGGALMYPVNFVFKSAKYTYKMSRKGCSVKYEHEWNFALPDIGQVITNWNEAMDASGCCCGLGVVTQLNTGRILVAGEGVVNGTAIEIPMRIWQDGSSGDSGQAIDDANEQATVLKGDFPRGLYEFSGGAASIIALQ